MRLHFSPKKKCGFLRKNEDAGKNTPACTHIPSYIKNIHTTHKHIRKHTHKHTNRMHSVCVLDRHSHTLTYTQIHTNILTYTQTLIDTNLHTNIRTNTQTESLIRLLDKKTKKNITQTHKQNP